MSLTAENRIIWQKVAQREAMQQIFICPRCGTQNGLGQRFCVGCGTPLATFCPYCGANVPPTSGFCPNCGAQLGQASRQPARAGKPTSGWAKFGGALFALGVLCIIIGPVTLLLMPPAEQAPGLMMRYIMAGALAIIVGAPLMFKR